MEKELMLIEKVFQGKQIRTIWNVDEEKFYISVIDIIDVLVESKDVSGYWRKLKQRLKKEGNETVTNCHTFKMKAADGKMRQTDVADQQQLFRLIQQLSDENGQLKRL